MALNTSAICAGQGLGTAFGGVLIAQGKMLNLNNVGFALMLSAMGLSVWAARYQKRS